MQWIALATPKNSILYFNSNWNIQFIGLKASERYATEITLYSIIIILLTSLRFGRQLESTTSRYKTWNNLNLFWCVHILLFNIISLSLNFIINYWCVSSIFIWNAFILRNRFLFYKSNTKQVVKIKHYMYDQSRSLPRSSTT